MSIIAVNLGGDRGSRGLQGKIVFRFDAVAEQRGLAKAYSVLFFFR